MSEIKRGIGGDRELKLHANLTSKYFWEIFRSEAPEKGSKGVVLWKLYEL